MTVAFVDLLPVAIGGKSDNTTGTNAIIDASSVPTANAWDCVNDPVGNFDDETANPLLHSYVRTSAVAAAGWRFKLQSLAEAGATNVESIVSVDVIVVRRRANVGTGAQMQLHVLAGGALYLNPAVVTPTTSYGASTFGFPTNPLTGAPWDKAIFNGTFEVGPTRPTPLVGNSFLHVTQVYAHVVYNVAPWGALASASGTWETDGAGGGGWQMVPVEPGTWTRS